MTVLAPQPRAGQSADQATSNARQLLCIDDNADITRAIALRLQRYGVDVSSAPSGREGLRLAVMKPPAVVITDVAMPDGSGDFVIRQLKSHARTAGIPVIVMSGVHDYQLASRMHARGAAAFLRKPVPFDELLFELNRFIDLTVSAGSSGCGVPAGDGRHPPSQAGQRATETSSSGCRFWRVDAVAAPPSRFSAHYPL